MLARDLVLFFFFIFGAAWAKLVEPTGAAASRRYTVSWKYRQVDYTELAKKRWIDKWSVERIAKHFGWGRTATVKYLGLLQVNPDVVQDGMARKLLKLKERRFRGK